VFVLDQLILLANTLCSVRDFVSGYPGDPEFAAQRGQATPIFSWWIASGESYELHSKVQDMIGLWLAGKLLKLTTPFGLLWTVWARLAAYWD